MAANFGQLQCDAAFVKNQGDRERNHRLEQVAENRVGIQPVQDRPDENPGQQEEMDRRQLEPPSQPLAGETGDQHDTQSQDFTAVHVSSPAGHAGRKPAAIKKAVQTGRPWTRANYPLRGRLVKACLCGFPRDG